MSFYLSLWRRCQEGKGTGVNTENRVCSWKAKKERLERQIAVTDRQIDALVCELYGLTEEEIKIVEGEG